MVDYFFTKLPGGTLLNLGSGSTSFEDQLRTVVGVDLSAPPTFVDRFVRADAHALPFSADSFDGVLLKDVIEHVADPVAVMREVLRVVRPEGALLLTTPRAIPRAVWDDPTHIRGFTHRAICSLFQLSGWRVTAGPRRIGGFPGAGRLGLIPHLETLMAVPGFGHWFGTNWVVQAVPAAT
jgi:SAM-dependent methyltransferase